MGRARTSSFVTVFWHRPACGALRSQACDCGAEGVVVKTHRVCANCGGELRDRRKWYCSRVCKNDSQVRAKDSGFRQQRELERAPEP